MNKIKITRLDVERFTQGDCHFLARAISKVTGWQLCAFSTSEYQSIPTIHSFVRSPDNIFIDIEGHHTEEKLFDNWGIRHELNGWNEFEWKDFVFWKDMGWSWPEYGPYTYYRARKIAPYVATGNVIYEEGALD